MNGRDKTLTRLYNNRMCNAPVVHINYRFSREKVSHVVVAEVQHILLQLGIIMFGKERGRGRGRGRGKWRGRGRE